MYDVRRNIRKVLADMPEDVIIKVETLRNIINNRKIVANKQLSTNKEILIKFKQLFIII